MPPLFFRQGLCEIIFYGIKALIFKLIIYMLCFS